MSGWDAVVREHLDPPWQEFWVDAYVDPPLGDYLDMQKAAEEAVGRPNEASIDALLATMKPLIADHNMTGRDGGPLQWKGRELGSKLVSALVAALKKAQDEGGAPADPLPRKQRRALSRGRGSPASASRRSTRSGASPG